MAARGGLRASSLGRSRRAAGRRPAPLSVRAALLVVRPRREERPRVVARSRDRRAEHGVSGAGSKRDTCGCRAARLSARKPSGAGAARSWAACSVL